MAGSTNDPGSIGPPIDYLVKDYAGFVQLLSDRLALLVPGWQPGQPAEFQTALIELLADAADKLSYFQDAVATEAYLGTARTRLSVRRHARFLNYPMHDGCNARAWVTLQVDGSADGHILPKGSLLLSRVPYVPVLLSAADVAPLLSAGAEPFETLHDLQLFSAHGEIKLVDLDGSDSLVQGATSAALDASRPLSLQVGDVLFFEEVAGADSGLPEDADPSHRRAVRLTQVTPGVGPSQRPICSIAWASGDALPFALRLSVTRARGNVVLVDHGMRLSAPEWIDPMDDDGRGGLKLARSPVTQQGMVPVGGLLLPFDPEACASAALSFALSDVRPAVTLLDEWSVTWSPQRDLLASGRFATDFVVEVDDGGRACLRFGDGIYGKRPDSAMQAHYRVGNGRVGNLGAETLCHVVNTVGAALAGITAARNPLPATGGTDPEPIDQVRLYAPQVVASEERAVTPNDYADVARRHPEVRDAWATARFTGSWRTISLTLQRRGGQPVDAGFKAELRAFLDGFRMMGQDLQISGPLYVPLDLAVQVTVTPRTFRSDAQAALLARLGVGGFFAPDYYSLGARIYLSELVAAAMQVPGVRIVEFTRFQRYGAASDADLRQGFIGLLPRELPQVASDPCTPGRGTLDLIIRGGR
jgi:hypothetical protein